MIIQAEIENTYYHYGKPEQVVAPGMKQSVETTISETSYRATAAPEYTFYPSAQPVLITGQATSNNPPQSPLNLRGDEGGLPMPNVAVKLGISVKGFDRYYTVTSDSQGNFNYTFTPGVNEAGTYSLWAVHPDVTAKTVQSTFIIAGLQMDKETMNIKMAKNRTIDIPVKLTNTGEVTIASLQFATETSTGISAGAINTLTSLNSGQSTNFTLRISADSAAPDTGYVTLRVSGMPSASGGQTGSTTARLDVGITLVTAMPIISTTPSYIDTGMVRGDQKVAEFTITNMGEETLKNARIEGPSTPWMTLTVNKAIGDIKPGASISAGVLFRPPDTLPQAVYDDAVVIYSDNHIPYTYHIQVTVTSSAVGNVLFDVLNEFMEDVPNATITFQHQLLTELMYTVKTGADGTVMMYDIPEGRYTFNISPPAGHLPTSGTFVINPGLTTTVPIALQMKLVDITWSVEPTTIQDKYEIVIHQTFETNVPAPVLITEPPSLTLPDMQPGQALNGEFTVTNYGLIAVDNVKLSFPRSFGEYDIEVFTSVMPSRLNAMQKITVPYRITKRLSPVAGILQSTAEAYACKSEPGAMSLRGEAEANSSLFDEVSGYGGSGCFAATGITTTGGYVCCPHAAQQTTCSTSTSFIIGYPTGCGGGGGGGYVYFGGGGGGGGQSGGGGTPQPAPQPIQTSKDCPCHDPNGPKVERCFVIPHDFLCVNKRCAGLMPTLTDICPEGGMIQRESYGGKCDEVKVPDCCDQNVFASCVTRLSKVGECSYYNAIGFNCISWVNVVIATCQAEACKK